MLREADTVRVVVNNDGEPVGPEWRHSSGHGLRGMSERVESCGGTIHTGPRAGGGFRVSAVLPMVGS